MTAPITSINQARALVRDNLLMMQEYRERREEYRELQRPLINDQKVEKDLLGQVVDFSRTAKIGSYTAKINKLTYKIEELGAENLSIRVAWDIPVGGCDGF